MSLFKYSVVILFLVSLVSADDEYCLIGGKRKVLVLGLDGTKGSVFNNLLLGGKLPSFSTLAYKYGKFANCTSTSDPNCATAHSGPRYGSFFPMHVNESFWAWVTSPGWSSVTTGVDNYKHRVYSNDFGAKVNFITSTKQYPTIFSRAKRLGLRTAASGAPDFLSSGVSDWGVIDFECGIPAGQQGPLNPAANSSCNLDYRAGRSEDDNNRDIETAAFASLHISDKQACADVVMAHFDTIDDAGHHCGFSDNECYENAIINVDNLVGGVLQTLSQIVAEKQEQWLVIVTADHGGHIGGHDFVFFDDEVVPFIAAVVAPFPVLLNDLTPPVKHYDTATTIMAWLGVSPDGQGLDGKVQAIPWPSSSPN